MGSDINENGQMVGRVLNSWIFTLLVAAFMLVVTFGDDYMGRLEGRYIPVVGNVDVQVSEGTLKHTSILSGSFDRLREDCAFDRIEWYLGRVDGRNARLDFAFLEPSQVRDTGPNDFGPWLLHATDLQIASFVYADVYHRCHGWWLTITRFYPQ